MQTLQEALREVRLDEARVPARTRRARTHSPPAEPPAPAATPAPTLREDRTPGLSPRGAEAVSIVHHASTAGRPLDIVAGLAQLGTSSWDPCAPGRPCPGCRERRAWCYHPRAAYTLLWLLLLRSGNPAKGSPRQHARKGEASRADILGFLGLDLRGAAVAIAPRTGQELLRELTELESLWNQGARDPYLADTLSLAYTLQARREQDHSYLEGAERICREALDGAPILPPTPYANLQRRKLKAAEYLASGKLPARLTS